LRKKPDKAVDLESSNEKDKQELNSNGVSSDLRIAQVEFSTIKTFRGT
jgi:hypothetical protein